MKRFIIIYIIVLSILYSALSIIRHNHYESGAFDLGLYDQSVWQYSQFLFPDNTIKGKLILADHLTLTLPLLAPLYWLWSDVRMLLIFQSVWLTVSAIPIYLIARNRKFPRLSAFLLLVLYSLFPGIQYAIYFDFHPVIIGVGLIPWIAYFLESGRKRLMWMAALLLVLTQENMGIALASLGLLYVFDRKYRRSAWLFIIAGGAATAISVRVISMISPDGFEYKAVISRNIMSLIYQFFDQPEKRQSWMQAFGWYMFIPIFSPGTMLASILDLSQYFLTGQAVARMWSPFTHHRAILGPLLTLGLLQALDGRNLFRNIGIPVILVLLGIGAITQQYVQHYPLNKLSKTEFIRTPQWVIDTDVLIRTIPSTYSVAAQHSIVPHLSHRSGIYLAWPRMRASDDPVCTFLRSDVRGCWWLDFPWQAKFLVVDIRTGQWLTQTLESDEHFLEAVGNMEKHGVIQQISSVGTVRLYGVDSTRMPR